MEKNEETIVVSMQFDFTATKKLEKPLYPDENPAECAALPILWVLNTEGQLAGWTVLYVPGIVAGERPLEMRSLEKQEQYWKRELEKISIKATDEKEQGDREVWEKAWQASRGKPVQTTSPENIPTQSPTQKVSQPSPQSQTQITTPPAQASQPTLAQPSQLGASTFGRPSQLGGTIPGQSHVFGQNSGLGGVSASRPGSMGSVGFAKYSGAPSAQASTSSGFLSGAGQSGSFLSAAKGGSFLQPGQSSSFLSGTQGNSFLKPGQDQGFAKFATPRPPAQDQGFAKFATSTPRGFGTPQNMTTPSSFSDGGFLGSRPAASSTPPVGASPKGSLSERTQSLTSPSNRNQSFDMLEDSSTESDESDESDVEDSEQSEGDSSVRVDALNFGDTLSLEGPTRPEFETPVKKAVGSPEQSPSSVGDGEYVKVGIPVTPSPEKGKTEDITPSAKYKSRATEDSLATIPPLPAIKAIPTPIASQKPSIIENVILPPDPLPPSRSTTSSLAVHPLKDSQVPSNARTTTITRNKVELRQFGPVSGSAPISRLSESADLSDAFRLVVEQVSKELANV